MGKQSSFLEHRDGQCPNIGQGRVVSRLIEPLPCGRPAVFGPIPQREEGFGAAECGTLTSDRHNLIDAEIRLLPGTPQFTRSCDEGAVVAPIAT